MTVDADATEKTQVSEMSSNRQALRDMFFLSIAYSANIGGTGSITGTNPNLIVKGELDR